MMKNSDYKKTKTPPDLPTKINQRRGFCMVIISNSGKK